MLNLVEKLEELSIRNLKLVNLVVSLSDAEREDFSVESLLSSHELDAEIEMALRKQFDATRGLILRSTSLESDIGEIEKSISKPPAVN